MTVNALAKTNLRKAAANMTEYSSARFTDFDTWSTAEAIAAMYEGQLDALAALRAHIAIMAEACDAAVLFMLAPVSPDALRYWTALSWDRRMVGPMIDCCFALPVEWMH